MCVCWSRFPSPRLRVRGLMREIIGLGKSSPCIGTRKEKRKQQRGLKSLCIQEQLGSVPVMRLHNTVAFSCVPAHVSFFCDRVIRLGLQLTWFLSGVYLYLLSRNLYCNTLHCILNFQELLLDLKQQENMYKQQSAKVCMPSSFE